MTENLSNEEKITPMNPWYIKMSYGSREMFGQWITGIFGAAGIFFYRQVIGLTGLPLTLAFVLWSIYNAVNDPLVGYLMEKINFPWEKKKGLRRFPWIVIGLTLAGMVMGPSRRTLPSSTATGQYPTTIGRPPPDSTR